MKQRTIAQTRSAARGFALLEALVGLLIFSFGILGLVGLQASMTKAQSSSRYRSEAAALAVDLTGTMWSDVPHLTQYDTARCSAHPPCKAWAGKVATMLPQGTPAVAVNNDLVTITVSWTPPGETTANRYVTATAVHN